MDLRQKLRGHHMLYCPNFLWRLLSDTIEIAQEKV